jgi:DtxR family Mn-dependent transcriptional regulator
MYGLSDRAEEVLEWLWIEIEEKKNKPDINNIKDREALAELTDDGYIDVNKGGLLTQKGMEEATGCIRRHRLAERLLKDIFDAKENFLHEASCKFEHGLHYGLEDSICTLLGHPRTCPHGKVIPPGDCCKGLGKAPERLVVSLKDLSVQDTAKISYINTEDAKVLKKLIGMGILPGNKIKLLHRFPSFVFEMGNSHFAVDKDLAGYIHVLLLKRE